MSVLAAIGAIAPAVVSGVSSIFGSSSAKRQNQRAFDFQREMFDKQGQRELQYWNMQNQYNSPQAQMKRLQEAGLNPNLVYGNGADAQSAKLSAGAAPSAPSQRSEALDLQSVAQTALASQQLKANIDQTVAQTQAIKQNTAIGSFELEAKKQLGQSTFTRALAAKVQNASMQDEKQIVEYKNWLETMYSGENLHFNMNVDQLGHLPAFGSKLLQSQIKAVTDRAISEAQNIKSGIALRDSQLGIQELQKIIMKSEAEFVKMLGSKTGAGFALQLLRLILNR